MISKNPDSLSEVPEGALELETSNLKIVWEKVYIPIISYLPWVPKMLAIPLTILYVLLWVWKSDLNAQTISDHLSTVFNNSISLPSQPLKTEVLTTSWWFISFGEWLDWSREMDSLVIAWNQVNLEGWFALYSVWDLVVVYWQQWWAWDYFNIVDDWWVFEWDKPFEDMWVLPIGWWDVDARPNGVGNNKARVNVLQARNVANLYLAKSQTWNGFNRILAVPWFDWNTLISKEYEAIDPQLEWPFNYYRFESVDDDWAESESEYRYVFNPDWQPENNWVIDIYPNPVVSWNNLNLKLNIEWNQYSSQEVVIFAADRMVRKSIHARVWWEVMPISLKWLPSWVYYLWIIWDNWVEDTVKFILDR
jgi:hypothetical protein